MEHFRRIMIVGRALVGKQRGPLRYSGENFDLLTMRPEVQKISWRIVYWFWVPPGKRDKYAGASEVKDAQPFELAALADGVIEEVRFNIAWPADMKTKEASVLLKADYDRRVVKRLGVALEAPRAMGTVIDLRGGSV